MNIECKHEDCKYLINGCLSIITKFFENAKKIAREFEIMDPTSLGHLVPITVGHRDKPNEKEMVHIKLLLDNSGFITKP